MPRFSSQTRKAANINLRVRAIVPIAGSRDSSVTGAFGSFARRFDVALGERCRGLDSLENLLSSVEGGFIFNFAWGDSD